MTEDQMCVMRGKGLWVMLQGCLPGCCCQTLSAGCLLQSGVPADEEIAPVCTAAMLSCAGATCWRQMGLGHALQVPSGISRWAVGTCAGLLPHPFSPLHCTCRSCWNAISLHQGSAPLQLSQGLSCPAGMRRRTGRSMTPSCSRLCTASSWTGQAASQRQTAARQPHLSCLQSPPGHNRLPVRRSPW